MTRTFLALKQKGDGFSGRAEGPKIEDASLYLEAGQVTPAPLADGQVLIRMRMASVNPSDLHFIKGEYGQPRQQGKPAGFEGVGEVVDGVGASAEKLKGKRVGFVAAPEGSGTWGEYAITTAANCVPVRPDLRDEDAAGLIVNPLTAIAMFDIVRETGAKAFILTAANSQLCKLLVALGRDEGVAPICIVRKAEQAAHLQALGAAAVLVAGSETFAEDFAALSRTMKPRVMLDAVANQVSADIFHAMPTGARWVIYGKLDPAAPVLRDAGQFVFKSKRIEGFWLSRWMADTPMERQISAGAEVQERFATGKWKTEVTATLKLSEAIEKLPAALGPADGKVMLVP